MPFPVSSDKPLATLAANPVVFPGDREGDLGKVRMGLQLAFDTVEDAKAFLVKNGLSTLVFDRTR